MQGTTVADFLHLSFKWLRRAIAGQQRAEWEQEEGPLFCMILFIGLSPNYTVSSWIATILVVLSTGMNLGI